MLGQPYTKYKSRHRDGRSRIASAVKEIKSVADIMATLEKEFDAAQARVAQL